MKEIKAIATKTHSMVCRIDMEMKSKDEICFFLANDLHLDHPKCRRELLKEHLDEIMRRKGYILLNGDIVCVMQGISDKRHNKSSVRPEDATDAYFDSVVDNAAKFLLPYAKRILFMGFGNHETAVIKKLETNLLQRLVEKLYFLTGHRIVLGEYHGFIYIVAKYRGNERISNRSAHSYTYKIYHNHGAGGDAPITQGRIEDSRLQMYVEGADAIWTGHNHNKYAGQTGVMYLDTNPQSMAAKIRIIDVIRSGGYKQEYTGHGFHIEKRGAPKPLGGTFLNLQLIRNGSVKSFLSPKVEPTWHEAIEI